MADPAARNHIFISYAWEDAEFARWLAKALTREGYSVWIDCEKLLGGEPFPSEITEAINERTHRFVAVMSHHSLNKTSPRRERTLADKAGRKLGISDFLIPLSVDSLSPNDFDFITTELTALPFQKNWHEGLQLLLKKLVSTDAPRDIAAGRKRLAEWYSSQIDCVGPAESLISNLVEIEEIPEKLHCFKLAKSVDLERLSRTWVYWKSKSGFWSFSPPSKLNGRQYKKICSVSWRNSASAEDVIPRNVVVTLIFKHLLMHTKKKGLVQNIETERLRFKEGIFEKNKIRYTNLKGRKTSVLIRSERTSGYKDNVPVKFLAHLEPSFRVVLDRFAEPCISIAMQIGVSDLSGRPFRPKQALSKRKKATRGWINSHWLARNLAFLSWLTDGKKLVLLKTEFGNLSLDYRFKEISIDKGIDEPKIGEMKATDPFDDVADE